MKTIKRLAFLALLSLSVVGCQNTMSGFGQDMEKNGQEIQKSAHSS